MHTREMRKRIHRKLHERGFKGGLREEENFTLHKRNWS